MEKQKKSRQSALRKAVQLLSGLAANAHLKGFVTGKIYTGPLKQFCVPGLNCYSCPGAVGACPIGSLQAVVGSRKKFPFLILGYLALIGVVLGRFVCGWLCLFGLVQELLYQIPTPKLKMPHRADRVLRWGKYFFLLVFVFALPAFLKEMGGLVSVPYFCKYVCPAGMLEGGIPVVALNSGLRQTVGRLFAWKWVLLGSFLLSSVFIYRPFCKYVCPLGAFYSLFQRFSFLRLRVDREKCVDCGKCVRDCPMGVDVLRSPNSPECIRCGGCTDGCPTKALKFTFRNKKP